jgi:sugar transferase (PEP-CTERM/EpsH1 system associated)
MKILFVVPNVPSRIRARPFNLIRRLARIHDVSVLCLSTNDSDRRFVEELRQYCRDVEVIGVSRLRSLGNCLAAMFSLKPLRYAYFHSPELQRRVREKVRQKELDVLHVEHLKAALILENFRGQVPSVLDAVDCVSLFELRRRRILRSRLLKAFSWTEWKKMRWWENKIGERFDRLVISSNRDKERYPASPALKDRLDVVRNGVDLEYFAFRPSQPRSNLVVFCAKLDYSANADAGLYLCREIWPRLLARRPQLQLNIVGSGPPRGIMRFDGRNNIRVTGAVPDVRPHLAAAAVAVCPVRMQAGTQFKILEAMALGVPVVATRMCCPALAVEPGTHLLVADAPEEYVTAVESLLDDILLRQKLVEAARRFVETYHDWDTSLQRLLQAYAGAIADFEATRTEPSGAPAGVGAGTLA